MATLRKGPESESGCVYFDAGGDAASSLKKEDVSNVPQFFIYRFGCRDQYFGASHLEETYLTQSLF